MSPACRCVIDFSYAASTPSLDSRSGNRYQSTTCSAPPRRLHRGQTRTIQLRMDLDSQRFVGGVQIGNVGSNAAVPRLAKERGPPLEMETPREAFQTQSCYFPPAKFRPSSCTSLR